MSSDSRQTCLLGRRRTSYGHVALKKTSWSLKINSTSETLSCCGHPTTLRQETVILNCIFHTPKAEYIYLLCPMKLLFLLYDNMSKVRFILYLAYGVLAELYLLFGGNSGLRTSEYKWLQWELFNSKFI